MKSEIKKIKINMNGKNINYYYGFIKAIDDGKDYYFTKFDIKNLPIDEIFIGQNVEFEPQEKANGERSAKNIKLISDLENIRKNECKLTFEQFENNLIASAERIKEIISPDDFENAVYLLLKLLGIHKVFHYEPENQAGKADGFFIIENMAVMYDCTLRSNFKEFKKDQIENYINKLSKSNIEFNIQKLDGSVAPKKTFQIQEKVKQVWIITKGKSQELRDVDSIKVKEISIYDLLNVLSKRMKNKNYDIECFVNDLMFIGK